MQATTPDEDRSLLSGEPAESPHRDEIDHWLRVYRELVDAIGEMLEQMPAQDAEPPYTQRLRARYEDLVRSLEYWTDQAPELRLL